LFTKALGVGIIGWFGAASLIKYARFAEPETRWSDPALFAIAIPIGSSVAFLPRFLKIAPKESFIFVSLVTATAITLDGFFSVTVPWIYTFQQKTPLEALAMIAFGGGFGLFASYLISVLGTYGF
jgi:hypothetical protein